MSFVGVPDDGYAGPQPWLAGADLVIPGDRWAQLLPGAGGASPPPTAVPIGRLHAVDDTGVLVGRGLCQAPVTLLDPVRWRWPHDADQLRPLCWSCLALTRRAEDRQPAG
jgi:hypothetical protein